MNNQKSIAIIPARGGSKRVPRKNIRPFGGKPLIAHTIEAARNSGLFARVVVSTDSEEVARIAREQGAEVPFVRSAHLADDITPVSEVTADALDRLDPEGNRFTFVAQLMANCPLRDADDLRESFDHFRHSGADVQISVVSFAGTNPWWAMRMTGDGRLHPVFEEQLKVRSQDLPPLYAPTGATWWARVDVVRRERTFHVRDRTGYALTWDHALDIDTEEDWQMGEFLLRYNAKCESSDWENA
jgi:N-acylneuraminate cytidylyltransferase